MEYENLTSCLACGKDNLELVIHLGHQPLANTYPTGPSAALPKYELAINHCKNCSHFQLVNAVHPDLLYRDYQYVSGTTTTLRKHFEDLAAVSWQLPYKRVLDIGCNDGSLLEQFSKNGCTVQGVDPAENLRAITEAKNIPVVVDYWNADCAYKVDGDFGLITALNCLAHNADPYSFLLGCKRVLRPDGFIVIEFPYFGHTLDRFDFGQIYHEHHSYFTVKSMAALVERVGLNIVHIREFPEIHGGTLRFIINRVDYPVFQVVKNYIQKETYIQERAEEFRKRVWKIHWELARVLSEYQDSKIVAYGASAKSSTLFNLDAAKQLPIDFVVDDNPLKQGRFCPGSNLPIYSPSRLVNYKADNLVILLTVHNFKNEVLARLRELGLSGALLINYTPEVSVEEV